MTELSDAKRRIVERLKRVDTATAGELAAEFDLTDTAIRQHLEAMQEAGLVHRSDGAAAGRGRPAARWRLSEAAVRYFPDRHVDLTLDLLDSIRLTFGDAALEAVVATRARHQIEQYQRVVGNASTAVRVRRLAEQRSNEGYVAEVVHDGDDLVLVEHHCPVSSAARSCGALCNSELEVFRAAIGDGATVVREQHVMSGDHRCAYRITAA